VWSVKPHFYFVSPIRSSKKSQGKLPTRLFKKLQKMIVKKNGKRPLPKMKNTFRVCRKEPLLKNGRKVPALFLGGLENSTLEYAIEIH
jgi:hypothetical protein